MPIQSLMWSGTQRLEVRSGAAVQQIVSSAQTSSIQHHQPETWSFMLAVQLSEIITLNGGNPFQVWFELSLSLGRSTIVIPRFGVFSWENDAEAQAQLGVWKILQRVEADIPASSGPGVDPAVNIIDRVAAQGIQCVAKSNNLILGAFTFNVASFFSPLSIGR